MRERCSSTLRRGLVMCHRALSPAVADGPPGHDRLRRPSAPICPSAAVAGGGPVVRSKSHGSPGPVQMCQLAMVGLGRSSGICEASPGYCFAARLAGPGGGFLVAPAAGGGPLQLRHRAVRLAPRCCGLMCAVCRQGLLGGTTSSAVLSVLLAGTWIVRVERARTRHAASAVWGPMPACAARPADHEALPTRSTPPGVDPSASAAATTTCRLLRRRRSAIAADDVAGGSRRRRAPPPPSRRWRLRDDRGCSSMTGRQAVDYLARPGARAAAACRRMSRSRSVSSWPAPWSFAVLATQPPACSPSRRRCSVRGDGRRVLARYTGVTAPVTTATAAATGARSCHALCRCIGRHSRRRR